MKPILISLFALVTVCMVEAIESKTMTPEDLIAQYEKALASQQWEAVAPLMHPNCTVTFSDGTLHAGKKAVEKAFRGNFAMIEDESYAISKIHWIVKTTDFAVFSFVYDWSGKMGGTPVAGAGRGTSSLVRENGVWVIAAEHLGPKSAE